MASKSNIVAIEELPTWNTTEVPDYFSSTNGGISLSDEKPTFPCRPDLNDKIIFWRGELPSLRVQCIVDPFNENQNEWIGINGGKQLIDEMVYERKQCRTSDARVFRCYNVPCRSVIRVVTPRFNEKYVTAAESALYNCYRNALSHLIDNNFITVAIEPLHLVKRSFPLDMGAHIAIRTIRRFLEKFPHKVDRILFHLPSQEYEVSYQRLAPIYFPRNRSEEIYSNKNCPADIGNEDGEPVHRDRPIRIFPHPHPLRKKSESSDLDEVDSVITTAEGTTTSENETNPSSSSTSNNRTSGILRKSSVPASKSYAEDDDPSILVPGRHSFARMETDPDTRRRQQRASAMYRSTTQGLVSTNSTANNGSSDLPSQAETESFQRDRRYQRLLREAGQPQRAKDIASISAKRILYQCGTDVDGRAILLVVGRAMDWRTMNSSQALSYFIHYMDRIVNNEYYVVYLQTMTTTANQPSMDVIRRIYDNVDDRYRYNLRGLLILHCTLWNRVMTWFLKSFTGPVVKSRIIQVANISELYRIINPRQLDLPEFVYEHDKQLFGKASAERPKSGSSSNDAL